MNDSQDRLRDMLHRRGDRVHSSLTIPDIRDAGMRSHRHPMGLIGPLLVAASVVIVVVVVMLTGRPGTPSVPPAGPGSGVHLTTPNQQTVPRSTVPSATRTLTTSPLPAATGSTPTVPTTAGVTTTVQASP